MKKHIYLSVLACLLAGVAVWTAYAQADRTAPNATTWNYKTVVYITPTPVPGSQSELYEDGQKLATPENGSLPKLKEVGAAGWELVTVVERPAPYNTVEFIYYFKRPR